MKEHIATTVPENIYSANSIFYKQLATKLENTNSVYNKNSDILRIHDVHLMYGNKNVHAYIDYKKTQKYCLLSIQPEWYTILVD